MQRQDLAETGLLQTFVAVVETASFTDGARRVGITRSAAGKAIARLEDLLGCRLLHRTTRHVSATADGQVFYERASQILLDLEEAQEAAAHGLGVPRGTLRLTAPEAIGRLIILPILGEFLERWPDLKVEASFTDRVVDIVGDGFDLAIRAGTSSGSPELITRTIWRQVGQLAASPSYLNRYGRPEGLDGLQSHKQLVSGNQREIHSWVFEVAGKPDYAMPMRPALLFDNASALLDAAVAGLGLACLPSFLIRSEVEAGRLEVVLPSCVTKEIAISVVYPSRRYLPLKVRLFIDLLVARLS